MTETVNTKAEKHYAISSAVLQIIRAIGEDSKREGLQRTPIRVADTWETFTKGYGQDPEHFLKVQFEEKTKGMVIIKNIEFYSLCEHHLLPFYGEAFVGYIPDGKVVGASKIPRVVDIFASRLQNQERMTKQIADSIVKCLEPKGVMVVTDGIHLCMRMRGVEKQNSIMTTSEVSGVFDGEKTKAINTRNEFLQLIGNSRRGVL